MLEQAVDFGLIAQIGLAAGSGLIVEIGQAAGSGLIAQIGLAVELETVQIELAVDSG